MKKRKKVNKRGLIVILLSIYLIAMIFLYVINLKVKDINIYGNEYVTDEEILNTLNITSNTKIITLTKNKLSEKIETLSLIKEVNIKKSINGNIKINIVEYNILFYNNLNNTYVLDNGNEVDGVSSSLGVPSLINYVPSDIYNSFIKKLSNIDLDIISLISEIEYSPSIKDNITIDGNRFLLRMNDGNYVYINLANFSNLNEYIDYYSTLDVDVKGVLNLDSSSENGILFQSFESLKKEEEASELSE